MAKPRKLSGFPEWLPEEKIIEQFFIDKIRQKFELFGFVPIETRSVEPLETLLSKGDDKEIYVLKRLHAEPEKKADFGLHFDMTVPFARYVQQNRGQLIFPFKRYQIQKAWRGERPQEGRYREFYQADIDVIAENELDISYDAEFPRILAELFDELPIPNITIKLNNRKILSGFYKALGITDTMATLRIVDKLDKIGADKVEQLLIDDLGLEPAVAKKCVALGTIKTADSSFYDKVTAFELNDDLLSEGLDELKYVIDALSDLPKGSILADLSIARGLDYYTGTVLETEMQGFEKLGSVCSGGRYDNLAGDEKIKLPGMGVSIGLTRILAPLLARKMLKANRQTNTLVLVALVDEESRKQANELANTLRSRGIATEVHHSPQKFGKQIRAAERKGIPYVWFYDPKDHAKHGVKNIVSGEQSVVDPSTWEVQISELQLRLELIRN